MRVHVLLPPIAEGGKPRVACMEEGEVYAITTMERREVTCIKCRRTLTRFREMMIDVWSYQLGEGGNSFVPTRTSCNRCRKSLSFKAPASWAGRPSLCSACAVVASATIDKMAQERAEAARRVEAPPPDTED